MSENEKKQEVGKEENAVTWKDLAIEFANAKSNQNVATEIILQKQRESKAKNVGIICGTVIACAAILGLLIVNHLNTKQFTEYLSNYDFVSQDGEGYNYYNSDIGGDVSNGAKDSETEEQE